MSLVKKNSRNKTQNLLKQILAFSLVFFVLISTCSIQRGIKTVFGIPLEISQNAKGAKIATASYGSLNCVKCAEIQTLAADNSLSEIEAPEFQLAAIFTFFFLPPVFYKENKPVFNSPKLTGEIPKYLLFSRLLFYDLR